MKRKYRIYFLMVQGPEGTWRRVGKPFRNKKAADSWTEFVQSYYRGWPTIIARVNVRVLANGKVHPSDKRKLDIKYNCDV